MGTIVVGYVASAEGRAALTRGVEEAKLRSWRLIVANSNKGGHSLDRDEALRLEAELNQVRADLEATGLDFDVRGLVRGQEISEDMVDLATEVDAELIVIGIRRRSPVGKLVLGSTAATILLEADCTVIAARVRPYPRGGRRVAAPLPGRHRRDGLHR